MSGTATYSAWKAHSAPPTATRSPTPEPRVARVAPLHDPGGAVAQRAGNLEAVADFLHCGAPAERAGRVEHLAHLVRARARLLQQVHARLLDLHFLGADADDRVSEPHEDAAGRGGGRRDVLQLQSAVLVLGDLFQVSFLRHLIRCRSGDRSGSVVRERPPARSRSRRCAARRRRAARAAGRPQQARDGGGKRVDVPRRNQPAVASAESRSAGCRRRELR